MTYIGHLLCGDPIVEGIAKSSLEQLATSIALFSRKSMNFLVTAPSDDTLIFGPFCARVLLENSCAALVGRLDLFRILYLSEFQSQPEYEYGKRAKSSFSWFGDVIPDDKAAQPLWITDHEMQRISRALFSKHADHVYWRPAVEKMLDFISTLPSDPLLAEILGINSEHYTAECKGRSSMLYSTLSKGVHWEFFTSALVFDDATVKAAIRDTCLLIGRLGLTSHFIPTAYASLSPLEAVEKYVSFRRELP